MRVPTAFWWDNFDRNIDIKAAGESIHHTPGEVFQERTAPTIPCQLKHEMTKTNRQSLVAEEEEPHFVSKINSKCNPGTKLRQQTVRNGNVFNIIDELLALWKAFRYAGIEKNTIALFEGLVVKLFGRTDLQRTYLTYLPPITTYSLL